MPSTISDIRDIKTALSHAAAHVVKPFSSLDWKLEKFRVGTEVSQKNYPCKLYSVISLESACH